MDRPILFSGLMVRAILDGRKTQTRRVFCIKDPMGKKHAITSPKEEILEFDDGSFNYLSTGALSGPYPCPYGHPGDRLWVREAWRTYASLDHLPPRHIEHGAGIQYEAGGSSVSGCDRLHGMGKYRPPMFMPIWASRITLEIADIRVERLQDISEADAISEGVYSDPAAPARDGFQLLWNSINAARGFGWDSNPWVWVISFNRVD